MQGTGRSTSACASCRHQRKRCTEKCALSPYFTVSRSREFEAVHKIFGVSNAAKILKSLREQQERDRAVDSLVWEALWWRKDPAGGPYGEYRRVWEELRMYKSYYKQLHQPRQQSERVVVVNMGNNQNGEGTENCQFCPYGFLSHQGLETGNVRVERENPMPVIVPNQQSFIPGMYNPLDSKSLESTTLWEGSS